ncbi:MAG TPA: hypothetical protein VHP63_04705, partial [candidate division Zixibacteria bacterium]|nr:hypothetical protein [candidate division Zixibacteria bacterium]
MMGIFKLKNGVITLTILICLLALSAQAVQHSGGIEPKPTIIKGRVTIQFEDNVNTNQFLRGFGKVNFNLPTFDALMEQFQVSGAEAVFPWHTERPAINSGRPDMTRFWEIYFPESFEVAEVIKALNQNP